MSVTTGTTVMALWAQALRSGEFKQGQDRLHTRTEKGDKFCCLGVLCEVAIRSGVDLPVATEEMVDDMEVVYYAGCGQYLPPQVWAWAGLDGDNPNVVIDEEFVAEFAADDRTYPAESHRINLAELNDTGATFDMIAGLMERGMV